MALKTTKKILKKNLKKEDEITMNETPIVVSNTKHIWYSGFCLTDLFNFAEFDVDESLLPSKDDVVIKKFDFNKTNLSYVLGDKIKKSVIVDNCVIFDNIKNKFVNELFYNYFLTKFSKEDKIVDFYWIKSFNGKDKDDYEMIGIVVNDDLKGVLYLKKLATT